MKQWGSPSPTHRSMTREAPTRASAGYTTHEEGESQGLDPDVLEKYYKSGKEERARIAQSTVRSYVDAPSTNQSGGGSNFSHTWCWRKPLSTQGSRSWNGSSRRPELSTEFTTNWWKGRSERKISMNKLLPWTGLQDAEGMTKNLTH